MKKYINLALIYAVCALVAGVFYREFTKWNGFTGVTTLGKVHTHLFMLGMFLFLFVALFAQNLQFDFTRRGQRQLGARHKRAHGNQQQQNQNGFKNIHIKYKRVDNF